MSIQLFSYHLNSLLSVDGRRRPDNATIQHYFLSKATPLQACLTIVEARTRAGAGDGGLGSASDNVHPSS